MLVISPPTYEDMKTQIPAECLNRLISSHGLHNVGDNFDEEFEVEASTLYARIGLPILTCHTAWSVFEAMLALHMVQL